MAERNYDPDLYLAQRNARLELLQANLELIRKARTKMHQMLKLHDHVVVVANLEYRIGRAIGEVVAGHNECQRMIEANKAQENTTNVVLIASRSMVAATLDLINKGAGGRFLAMDVPPEEYVVLVLAANGFAAYKMHEDGGKPTAADETP